MRNWDRNRCWFVHARVMIVGVIGGANAQRLQVRAKYDILQFESHGVVANPVAFWGQRPRFESVWDYFYIEQL
jgi:hypothetical protein